MAPVLVPCVAVKLDQEISQAMSFSRPLHLPIISWLPHNFVAHSRPSGFLAIFSDDATTTKWAVVYSWDQPEGDGAMVHGPVAETKMLAFWVLFCLRGQTHIYVPSRI